MKILHISSEPPGEKSGGQLVVKQSVFALNKLARVDYLGPIIKSNEIKNLLQKKYYIKTNRNIVSRMSAILKLNFSSYYNSFNKIIKSIEVSKYDYIYIEFSKWLFAIKYIKKQNKKVIIRLHNIEKDYSYNIFKLNKTIKNYISYVYYSYTEKRMLKLADNIIVLTEKDKKRLKELYNNYIDENKIIIMPVCVRGMENKESDPEKTNINILVTGSLWYGPNYEGIKWFIDNVWANIRQNSTLYIVGSNPNSNLVNHIKTDERIVLVENPEDTKEYFKLADIYISPIFSGAGMKVKNAEAMSYGIPIVGTDHSFIGYESSMNLHYRSNTAEEFIYNIKYHINKKDYDIVELRKDILNDFNRKYNIDKCYKYIKSIL